MRFLKLASAKNPDTDYVLLNGGYFDKKGNKNENFNKFDGFLCISFQSIGISRKLEFLAIKNRQFAVENKPNFKKYSLTIEILTKYSEYEQKHRELITFLDRNKKDGFRLYFRPYGNRDNELLPEERTRYCLCDIEMSVRVEKLQPVILTLTQNSLWFGEEKISETEQIVKEKDGLFSFNKEVIDGKDYYSTGFYFDEESGQYCVEFFNNISTKAIIENNGYNEIPLNMKVYGPCVNPIISIYKEGELSPIRQLQVYVYVDKGYYLEINSNVLENGVWLKNDKTGQKDEISLYVNYEIGSPYVYIDNGKYYIKVEDSGQNICDMDVLYKEEYSE